MDATRFAGFTAAAFVLLGVLFSLLLPARPPHPVDVAEREPVEGEAGAA